MVNSNYHLELNGWLSPFDTQKFNFKSQDWTDTSENTEYSMSPDVRGDNFRINTSVFLKKLNPSLC